MSLNASPGLAYGDDVSPTTDQNAPGTLPIMKTYAAYYALLAMNSIEQDDRRRHAELTRAPRPSILTRARTLLASARPAPRTGPATTSA